MADFVGLLKKTIDAQSNMTPQLRQRIYERAKAAVERKLSEKPLAPQVVSEQRAILQHAIDEVEAYYLAQEGMDELLNFPFDEDDSSESFDNPANPSHLAGEPTVLPENDLSTAPAVLPEATDEISSNRHNSSNFDHNDQLVNASPDKAASAIGSQDSRSENRFGIVREETAASETLVLPIADQHGISNENNDATVITRLGENYNASEQSRADEQARLEAIELEREEERRIAAEQAQREAEEKARLEAIELEREEERRIAAEQAQREAEEKARLEAIELEREEERRIAAEQAQREAEEKARLEAIELEREEERRIAAEQAQREAEEKARLEAIELEREEERRIAAEQAQREAEAQALKEAEDREREEDEQFRLAQERMRIAEQARLEAEALEKSEEEARIAAEAKALEDEAARLEAVEHARRAEDAKLEAQAKAKDEELAKQASEQHLDAKEKAVLEVDARLSIEGARTIIPRKSENSNFDPSSYRVFDGNLDIAAERDIAGSRKEKQRLANPELMPMPPLVSSSKADGTSDRVNGPNSVGASQNLNAQTNDLSTSHALGAPQSADTNKKSDDNFDLVSDIFSQAARRDQKSARSHVGMIIVIIIIVLAALGAGIYLLFPSEKTTQPATTATDSSATNVTQSPASPPATSVQNDATANTGTNNNQSNGATTETAISTPDTTTVTPDANKGTERLMPDGREVVVGPSQQGSDSGSEGTSSTQATSIVQRSANATFYERATSVLPASASHGIVEWKLIRAKAKDNGPDELAIRGDILIPERDLTARITIRRNDDPSIRADFLIDLSFIVPENFDGGSVADIERVLFKAAENSTGQELTGMLPVKVDTNFFIIAVSSNASGSNRNLNLDVMRQFRWITIPVIYENGRVAEFSIDKGDFGDNIFKQVIDDWLTQNRWAQSAGSSNTIAPVVTNPAPTVASPSPASPPPANTAPVGNATQNTAPASNAVPVPNNVPVPTTPATVPVPSSVPVPSAPPAQ